jgi:hypothetical protein
VLKQTQDSDEIIERVAALDIGKAEVMCCVRVPDEARQVAIAEIGVDMGRFPTPGHLCSWAKYAPGISESAGKKKGSGATGHGNPYLARILGEAACPGVLRNIGATARRTLTAL